MGKGQWILMEANPTTDTFNPLERVKQLRESGPQAEPSGRPQVGPWNWESTLKSWSFYRLHAYLQSEWDHYQRHKQRKYDFYQESKQHYQPSPTKGELHCTPFLLSAHSSLPLPRVLSPSFYLTGNLFYFLTFPRSPFSSSALINMEFSAYFRSTTLHSSCFVFSITCHYLTLYLNIFKFFIYVLFFFFNFP